MPRLGPVCEGPLSLAADAPITVETKGIGWRTRVRITQGSAEYDNSIVLLDGTKIVDYAWADDERGEVMVITAGPRDERGFRKRKQELRQGKVEIILNAGSSRF